MVVFEDIQDIEEWLAPFDLDGFWEAVTPWDVFTGEDRARFERILSKRTVSEAKLLFCLKGMVCFELTTRFGLKDRLYEPPDAQYLRSVH